MLSCVWCVCCLVCGVCGVRCVMVSGGGTCFFCLHHCVCVGMECVTVVCHCVCVGIWYACTSVVWGAWHCNMSLCVYRLVVCMYVCGVGSLCDVYGVG